MPKVLTSGSSILLLLLFITIASLKSISAANLYNYDDHNGKISLINNNNAASLRHNHLNLLNNNNHRVQRSVHLNHNYFDQQRNPLDYIANLSDDNEHKKPPHERIPLFIDGSNGNDEDDNDDEVDDNDDDEEDDYDSLAEIINNNRLSKSSMDKSNKEDQDLYYRKRRQILKNAGSNNKYLDVVKKNYPVKRNVDVMKMMEHQWIGPDSNRAEKTAEQDDLDLLFGLHKDEKKKNLSEKSNSGLNKKEDNVQKDSQVKPTKNTVNMNSVNPTMESHFSTKNTNNNNNVNPTAKPKAKEELTQEQVHITSKKKKNIDWSQYFGIDKRMRQPNWSFAGKPDTEKEDDDWLIRHYYQTMAENLNNHAHLSPVSNNNNVNSYKAMMKRNNENKIDKYSRDPAAIDQIYEIDDEDTQKVKDKILSQLAAAYSLEKMRKALDELKHNIKIHQQQGESYDNDYRVKDPRDKKNYYSKANVNDYDLKSRPYFFHQDKKSECPSAELEEIKQHCMPVNDYIGGQMLFLSCIRHQICKMCSDNSKEEKKCINFFAIEAARICDNIEQDDDDENDDVVATRDSCRKIAVSITQLRIPPLAVQDTSLCYKILTHSNYNSCLKDFEQQEQHNYFNNNNNNNNNYYPYKM